MILDRFPVLATSSARRTAAVMCSSYVDDVATVDPLIHQGHGQRTIQSMLALFGSEPEQAKSMGVAQLRAYLEAFVDWTPFVDRGAIRVIPKWASRQTAISEINEASGVRGGAVAQRAAAAGDVEEKSDEAVGASTQLLQVGEAPRFT